MCVETFLWKKTLKVCKWFFIDINCGQVFFYFIASFGHFYAVIYICFYLI